VQRLADPHRAPDTAPGTGIVITDSVDAAGGRVRASTSHTACAKLKISAALPTPA